MDRISFFNSISGIDYPEMLVKFYDHFLALHQLIICPSLINVVSKTEDDSISFLANFSDINQKNQTAQLISGQLISIYGRTISINTQILTDTELIITLK